MDSHTSFPPASQLQMQRGSPAADQDRALKKENKKREKNIMMSLQSAMKTKNIEQAMEAYAQLKDGNPEKKLSPHVYSIMINLLGGNQQLTEARAMFEELKSFHGTPAESAYATMIRAATSAPTPDIALAESLLTECIEQEVEIKLRVVQVISQRASCVMPGTDASRSVRPLPIAYEHGPIPITLCSCYAMSGTDLGYRVLLQSSCATPCPVLIQFSVPALCPCHTMHIALRFCCTMSGADRAYLLYACSRYTMFGTLLPSVLRICCAMSGTDRAYGTSIAYGTSSPYSTASSQSR
eukprot:357870-Rhodomonas_salina.1